MIQPLWQVLVHATQDDEPLSCDQCYVLMDYLADLLVEGVSSEEVLALADRYLGRCPDCKIEYMYNLNRLTLGTEIEMPEGARVERAEDLTPT